MGAVGGGGAWTFSVTIIVCVLWPAIIEIVAEYIPGFILLILTFTDGGIALLLAFTWPTIGVTVSQLAEGVAVQGRELAQLAVGVRLNNWPLGLLEPAIAVKESELVLKVRLH
jgi:hypothetical protein